MIDTPEALAIYLLGQDAYDNSPCQANPYELIASAYEDLDRRYTRLREALENVLSEEINNPI